MEGREGMEAEGGGRMLAARCGIGSRKGRGAMEDREKLLEARKETWLCRDPEAYARLHCLPPIDGERPEILTTTTTI